MRRLTGHGLRAGASASVRHKHLEVTLVQRRSSRSSPAKRKPAVGAAAEDLAQLITGPVGHRTLGLGQQRSCGAGVGIPPVVTEAPGDHVDQPVRHAPLALPIVILIAPVACYP